MEESELPTNPDVGVHRGVVKWFSFSRGYGVNPSTMYTRLALLDPAYCNRSQIMTAAAKPVATFPVRLSFGVCSYGFITDSNTQEEYFVHQVSSTPAIRH
jgi:hypothetical protein